MNNQRIVMVGPVYPYKGGIAQYTSLLFVNLSKNYQVKLISFKVQYPRFLYPGKTQKDYQSKAFRISDVDYLINTISPLSWVTTAKKIMTYKPGLIIMQWWNPFFGPAYLMIIVLCKLFKKIKVLFICHNVLPHEKLPLDKLISKITLRKGDYYIVQSSEDEEKLRNIVPAAKYLRTPHPTYNIFKSDHITKREARIWLGIENNKRVLLYFGFVREYKGLIYLIEAMPRVKALFSDIKLLIAGEFFHDKNCYLNKINELNLKKNINIYDEYILDENVATFFSAADLIVLPYTSATQSGIVQIAYAFLKPVIVTRVGGLPEVVEHKKTGYVVPPKNSQQIADSIIDFYKENNESRFAINIRKQQERFSWNKMVESINELYL